MRTEPFLNAPSMALRDFGGHPVRQFLRTDGTVKAFLIQSQGPQKQRPWPQPLPGYVIPGCKDLAGWVAPGRKGLVGCVLPGCEVLGWSGVRFWMRWWDVGYDTYIFYT